jgi:perosamine synthetase
MATIPWYQPQIGNEEYQLIKEVLDSNFINDGEYTTRLENELAKRLGCRYVVAVSNGTSALFLSLKALEIGVGDEVIVPSITFIATANAVTMTGAKPVLVDVDPKTLNICPAAVSQAVTPRTRAIIPVHISGRAAKMPVIQEIASKHQLKVVEDAAEALLSKNFGQVLGTIGDCGCLSFSPMKTITTGQGGAILTNQEPLYKSLRQLKDQGRPVRGTGGADSHITVGYNFKLTNVQAAIGLAQLKRVDRRLERMRRSYRLYKEALSNLDELTLLGFDLDVGEVPQWIDALCPRRDELLNFLKKQHIDCRRFWYPVHQQAPYRQDDCHFFQASQLSPKAFWLPSAFTITDADIKRVCGAIHSFFQN